MFSFKSAIGDCHGALWPVRLWPTAKSLELLCYIVPEWPLMVGSWSAPVRPAALSAGNYISFFLCILRRRSATPASAQWKAAAQSMTSEQWSYWLSCFDCCGEINGGRRQLHRPDRIYSRAAAESEFSRAQIPSGDDRARWFSFSALSAADNRQKEVPARWNYSARRNWAIGGSAEMENAICDHRLINRRPL